jgi:hypothetical protein
MPELKADVIINTSTVVVPYLFASGDLLCNIFVL